MLVDGPLPSCPLDGYPSRTCVKVFHTKKLVCVPKRPCPVKPRPSTDMVEQCRTQRTHQIRRYDLPGMINIRTSIKAVIYNLPGLHALSRTCFLRKNADDKKEEKTLSTSTLFNFNIPPRRPDRFQGGFLKVGFVCATNVATIILFEC